MDENSIQNHLNTLESIKVVNNMKTLSSPPTPLYTFFFFFAMIIIEGMFFFREYSYCSTHPTTAAVSAFALFTSLAIAIGVLVVCLTLAKPPGKFLSFIYFESYFKYCCAQHNSIEGNESIVDLLKISSKEKS